MPSAFSPTSPCYCILSHFQRDFSIFLFAKNHRIFFSALNAYAARISRIFSQNTASSSHYRIIPFISSIFSHNFRICFRLEVNRIFFPVLEIYVEKSRHKISKGRGNIAFPFFAAVDFVFITSR